MLYGLFFSIGNGFVCVNVVSVWWCLMGRWWLVGFWKFGCVYSRCVFCVSLGVRFFGSRFCLLVGICM